MNLIPLTQQDSQLHFAMTAYKRHWVTKKEYIKAIKQIKEDWKKEVNCGKN